MTGLDLAQLHDHLAGARWFGGKGRDFTVAGARRIGTVEPGAVEPEVAVVLARVEYADGDHELYQLPLALYTAPQERLAHAEVGRWDDGTGTRTAYDAVHDRDAMARFLLSFGASDEAASGLDFVRLEGHDLDLDAPASPFAGEQSNSSVFFGEDSVLKLFRKVTPGENPDVTTHRVLTEAGSTHVAHLYGWIGYDDSHLGMLQQFLRTATDGWSLALASVRDLFAEADLHAEEVGGDFAGEAARLGDALAEVHAQLAAAFPTDVVPAATIARTMGTRLAAAEQVVPGLDAHAEGVRRVLDDLARLGDVPVQRVHGDLHLGQTLRTVAAWKIVDFEGEPVKPLAERLLPDSPWRDVAGMTRSFDYAPHAVAASLPEDDEDVRHQRSVRAAEWAARNRRAFLDAYTARTGRGGATGPTRPGLSDTDRTLLTAYVVDKAVYECVYEARNRPSWLSIPLAGLARLTT